MIWPYNLVLTTFLNTFHAEEDAGSGKITRFKFFMIAFAGAFAWYFLPGEIRCHEPGVASYSAFPQDSSSRHSPTFRGSAGSSLVSNFPFSLSRNGF